MRLIIFRCLKSSSRGNKRIHSNRQSCHEIAARSRLKYLEQVDRRAAARRYPVCPIYPDSYEYVCIIAASKHPAVALHLQMTIPRDVIRVPPEAQVATAPRTRSERRIKNRILQEFYET